MIVFLLLFAASAAAPDAEIRAAAEAMAPQLRRAAAAARELLVDLAAEKWGTGRETLTVAEGKVTDPRASRSASFGELTRGQKLVKTISGEPLTRPADQWQVTGQSVHKVDGRAMVTGAHQYSTDIRRPGMVYGKVLRPPALNARLKSVDTKAAEAMAGVTVVRDGDFVGVAAPKP